jgi:quinol monooxygenase YgiN
MTETPIILNVHFQATPGHEEKLGTQLHALVGPTHEEPGCLVYELHFDPEDSSKFMFYEKFANQAAIDHHLNTPHFKQFQNYLKANEPVAAQSVTRWRSFL